MSPSPIPNIEHAAWIWPNRNNDQPNTYALFRGTFSCSTLPVQTKLGISASSRYRLYVNEQLLPDGPAPSITTMQYVDEHDITPHLHVGDNVIAVVVHLVARQAGERGGLLAQVTDEKGNALLASMGDDHWQATLSDAWDRRSLLLSMNWFDCYQEKFDAQKLSAQWTAVHFQTDASWSKPVALTDGPIPQASDALAPWSLLMPRDIPMLKYSNRYAHRIAYVEQCTAVANRNRSEDLSIVLSTPGHRQLADVRIEGAENLLNRVGACVLQGSTDHINNVWAHAIYEPAVVLDFGQVVNGCLQLEVEGAAGTIISMGFAEDLLDSHFNNSIETQLACSYTLCKGRQCWTMFSWRAMRYVKIRVHHADQPLTIHHLCLRQEQYPFELLGCFESSVQLHNQIHALCQTTLDLCSHESLVDTPWREQGQWLGDVSAITLGGINACFGPSAINDKFMNQALLTQTDDHPLLANLGNATPYSAGAQIGDAIPDYTLWWIQSAWQQYQFTGNLDMLKQQVTPANRAYDHFASYCDDATGLLGPMPGWLFVDWANVDKRGCCAALNAILAGSMQALIHINQALGHDDQAATIHTHLAKIRHYFAPTFWDDQQQCLIDAVQTDTGRSDHISEHANAAAIYWDLVNPHQTQQILQNVLLSDKLNPTITQPFFSMVLLRALLKTGHHQYAVQLVEQRWGQQMVQAGYNSALEEWYAYGTRRSGRMSGIWRSRSHAWSAYPAEFFIRDLVGFEIITPGCASVRLQAPDVDFDFQTTIPTPRGTIKTIYSNHQLTAQTIPSTTMGNIQLEITQAASPQNQAAH